MGRKPNTQESVKPWIAEGIGRTRWFAREKAARAATVPAAVSSPVRPADPDVGETPLQVLLALARDPKQSGMVRVRAAANAAALMAEGAGKPSQKSRLQGAAEAVSNGDAGGGWGSDLQSRVVKFR